MTFNYFMFRILNPVHVFENLLVNCYQKKFLGHLAGLVSRAVALDLRIVDLSPALGIEIT